MAGISDLELDKAEVLDQIFRSAFSIQNSVHFIEIGGDVKPALENMNCDIQDLKRMFDNLEYIENCIDLKTNK